MRTFAGEDGFGFAHILVRDAAYDSMAKSLRADYHERCADWVETRTGLLPELDEILGHHLEQAHAYRLELSPAGDAESALAARAAEQLALAGRRALARDDAHAATSLLGRAAALRPGDAALLVDRAEAYFKFGDFSSAEDMNTAAIAAAEETDDARSAIAARLASSLIGLLVRAEGGVDEVADEINRALPTFEAAGDDSTVARLLTRLADGYWWRCQVGPMEEVLERALVHAHRAEDPSRVSNVSMRLGFATVIGPLAIDLGRPRLDGLIEGAAPDSAAKGVLLVASSMLAAMAGAFEEARSRCRRGQGDPRRPRPGRQRRCDHDVVERDRAAGRRCRGGGARAAPRAGAAPGDRRAGKPRVDRGAARRGAACAGSFRRGTRRDDHERGGVLSRRRPRPDRVARRACEGARPARPRPRGAGDRRRGRRARRHDRLAGARSRGTARARGGARRRRRGRGGPGRCGPGAAALRGKGNVVAARWARALSEELAARTTLTRG